MISINRKAVRASGGTQSDELKAKIKSVTSSITVGAVFVYDTSQDNDGGAWRKNTQGLSWYDEASSATRSSRKEFPSMALIVADNATLATVTIYDLDDPAMPMWMVFNAYSPAWETNAAFVSTNSVLSIFALNARMYVGGGNGLIEIDFITEQQTNFRPISSTQRIRHKKSGAIVDRNDTSGQFRITATPIANSGVNDVAASVLEGAEIGALGLPIPTVAVATDGGVSVIHPSGDVFDRTKTISSTVNSYDVAWGENGDLFWSSRAISSKGTYVLWLRNTLYADSTATPDALYYPTGIVGGNDVQYLGASNPYCNDFKVTKNGLAIGSTHGLSLIKHNEGNANDGAVAYVTSDYNTGYMLGDIRFAGLANSASADRSVKANTLSANGSVSNADVATSAELQAYSGFSASNYLSRANDADFDFGTGDFSIMFWVKKSTISGSQNWISRSDSTEESGDWLMQMQTDGAIHFYRHSGSGWSNQISTSAGSVVVNSWTQVVLLRRGTRYEFWVNGKLEGSAINSNSYTPSGGSALTIGHSLGQSTNPADNSSLSLVRISATSPTPQQVKDIYEAEKPLFRAGAKCLLQSDDASASDRNVVMDLAYDKSTDLLHVFQKGDTVGENLFRGLEVAESRGRKSNGWTYSSASYGAAAGGVSASARVFSGGGVVLDLPAIDVRAELNGSDSKLPCDGKLHFSGVIDDSGSTTPTVIGVLPIAEGETYYITARVFCKKYLDTTSAARASYVIEQKFRRPIGGNATASTPMSVLRDEGTASMDAVLSADTGSQQIRLTVTGVANTRSIWSAELDVERISEKTYER